MTGSYFTPNRIRALCRRLWRCQRGTSALEFSLIAPVVITLLLGVVEFSHIFLVQAEMTATARQAVRRLALDAMSESEIEKFVHHQLAGVTDADLRVAVESVPLNSGRTDLTVAVSVPVTDVSLFNLSDIFDTKEFTLAASGTMVKE